MSYASGLEKEILDELSVEKAFKHMEFLVNEVGERVAGTKEISMHACSFIFDKKSSLFPGKIKKRQKF